MVTATLEQAQRGRGRGPPQRLWIFSEGRKGTRPLMVQVPSQSRFRAHRDLEHSTSMGTDDDDFSASRRASWRLLDCEGPRSAVET